MDVYGSQFFVQPEGRGERLPEVYCIISPHGCFDLYSKVNSKERMSSMLIMCALLISLLTVSACE